MVNKQNMSFIRSNASAQLTNCGTSNLCIEGSRCHDITYSSDTNKKPVKSATVTLLQQVGS